MHFQTGKGTCRHALIRRTWRTCMQMEIHVGINVLSLLHMHAFMQKRKIMYLEIFKDTHALIVALAR